MSHSKWSSLVQSYTRCLIAFWILQSSQILGQNADNFDVGYMWVHADVRVGIPDSAVRGGVDDSGSPIYVGRAFHEGDLLPAIVTPDKQKAYVSYNGGEYVKYNIEVLVQTGARFQWMAGTDGDVPPDAIVGGYTASGEILYIGRADYVNSEPVGKVQVSKRGIYLPYGGEEVFLSDYEILVRKQHSSL